MKVLTRERLKEVTGYKQAKRQKAWLLREYGLVCAERANGSPVVTEEQIDAANERGRGKRGAANGPKWSRAA